MMESAQPGPEALPLAHPRRGPLPLVAIVGRRNVGKSTLFNRIVGSRKALVEASPGITRDRHYERVTFYEKPFLLVDTGGLTVSPEGIEALVSEQTRQAIEEADLLLFVVDAAAGLTPEERDIFPVARKRGVPLLVIANKLDVRGAAEQAAEFHELGVDKVYTVSAEHGRNMEEVLDAIEAALPASPEALQAAEAAPGIAVVGRPNVGKSTLVNCLLGEERVVVSPIPGTTRDPIDTPVKLRGKSYVLVDTAGIRRTGRVIEKVERWSVLAAVRSIERCDIALLVFDASEGLTEQDRRIAAVVEESGRALILVANKWDLLPPGTKRSVFDERVRYLLASMAWAPLVTTSAHKRQGMTKLVQTIEVVSKAFRRRVDTPTLNRVFEEILFDNPPPSPGGHPIKLNYATQVNTGPPTFLLHTNRIKDFPIHYRRYLQNQLRERLGLECVPVHLKLKAKHKSREPA